MEIAIYGAQSIAIGACEAIRNLYPKRIIKCFLVTKREDNANSLLGVPVLQLEDFSKSLSKEEKRNIEVLIATPDNVMPDIEKSLNEQGLCCYVRLTSMRWAKLMGYYYICNKKYMPLSALPIGYHSAKLNLFMAKFYKDKPLESQYNMPAWIIPIQVGATLCDKRVANLLDCDGENISNKNQNYSELTALYWIWKNRLNRQQSDSVDEYYGLCHYRRILELSNDDVLRLIDNDVDVILPYPMPYEPNIEEHHKRYLKDSDWNVLLIALEELYPQYASRSLEILSQRYLYNYNIIVAKKAVLSEYCAWLFPILERVEELGALKQSDREQRYIGYMGETLSTLYFMMNKNRLNIVHAGCKFLT